MQKSGWKEYFVFSKKERIAVVVLITLIVLFLIVPFFYRPFKGQPVTDITTLNQELARQHIDTISSLNEPVGYDLPGESADNKAELFAFDPNTLDAAGFKRLGLRDKTIHTIINYRSKGGYFRQPQDLQKIYGLKKEEADRLMPYIQIGNAQNIEKTDNNTRFTKPKPSAIDINTATIEQWKTLPAIGDALANRIVKFRDKIGGFSSITQVKQTYGLSDAAFEAITPYLTITAKQLQPASRPGKININTANAQQLQSKNIPEEVAKAIIIYRSQHGNYKSVEDIKKIVFINDEMYNKIAPYLSVE